MHKVILNKLKEIEEKENVKIILAIESGSRAWNFASSDSDYDVRFLYVRNKNDYLKLNAYDDVIEYELNEVMDINGWDIQKGLRLLYKSNPSIIEWLNSPIVYKDSLNAEKLRQISKEYFSEKQMINHYYNMAKRNYKAYIDKPKVKIKKYFYVLRPMLSGKYIMHTHEMCPLDFNDLIKYELDSQYLDLINEYLSIKKSGKEYDLIDANTELNKYLESEMNILKEYSSSLVSNVVNYDALNQYFLDILEN